jgi:hypothetical protein
MVKSGTVVVGPHTRIEFERTSAARPCPRDPRLPEDVRSQETPVGAPFLPARRVL